MRSTPKTRRRVLAPTPRVLCSSITPTAPVSEITGNSVVTSSPSRASMILAVVRHSSHNGRSAAFGSEFRSTQAGSAVAAGESASSAARVSQRSSPWSPTSR